jgi:GDP-D-mannose dehydratase
MRCESSDPTDRNGMSKRASITGTTAQDGCYLAEPLRGKGYEASQVDKGLVNFHTLEFPCR